MYSFSLFFEIDFFPTTVNMPGMSISETSWYEIPKKFQKSIFFIKVVFMLVTTFQVSNIYISSEVLKTLRSYIMWRMAMLRHVSYSKDILISFPAFSPGSVNITT